MYVIHERKRLYHKWVIFMLIFNTIWIHPIKSAPGLMWFALVLWLYHLFLDMHYSFIHIHQGCFTGTAKIIWLHPSYIQSYDCPSAGEVTLKDMSKIAQQKKKQQNMTKGKPCAFVLGCTVYPKKHAHGFVVLCFVVVTQSFIMNSHEVFIHIHQGCFAGTGAIVRLPQCQWSKPDGYGKISQCITTTKHSKAKTVCIFLGIYCTASNYLSMP